MSAGKQTFNCLNSFILQYSWAIFNEKKIVHTGPLFRSSWLQKRKKCVGAIYKTSSHMTELIKERERERKRERVNERKKRSCLIYKTSHVKEFIKENDRGRKRGR